MRSDYNDIKLIQGACNLLSETKAILIFQFAVTWLINTYRIPRVALNSKLVSYNTVSANSIDF